LSITVTEAVVSELHPFDVVVIVNIVVSDCCGALLNNVPAIGLPMPDAGIPVSTVVFVLIQLNEVFPPPIVFVRIIGVIADPGQMVCAGGNAEPIGIGFTVMLKLAAGPSPQELVPKTERIPDVAVEEKLIVMLVDDPMIVAPVPE